MFSRLPGSHCRFVKGIALAVFLSGTFVLGGCKTIPEGRSSVNEIQVRGADKVDEGDIKDKIATTESAKFLMLFRGVLFEYSLFDRFVLQRDLARVEAFYRSKGYYDVHARAGRVHELDNKHVRVEIVVEEGDAVMIREVHVDGLDGLPPDIVKAARLAAAQGLLTNEPFEEATFKKTEGLVRRALTDRGFAYAKVNSDAAVDIVAHKTDIVFTVTPGTKCVFGAITLEGLGQLEDAPVRRTIDIKPGEPFSEQLLDDAQQALLDLGVFASVELIPDVPGTPPQPANHPGKDDPVGTKDEKGNVGEGTGSPGAQGPPTDGPPIVPIRVKLEPSRLRTIRLGGGLEFDSLKTDVHGIIGWENRNFFGGLRSFTVTFRPGVVLYPTRVNNIVAPTNPFPEERLRVEFKEPGFLEARTNLFLRPEFNVYPVLINPNPIPDAPVIGYGELRTSVGLERTIWKFYGSISHNAQVAYPFGYAGGKDPTLSLIVISYPELYTTFDFRDDKIHPHKGIYIGNTFQVAGQIFGGSANDFKVQPELRGYLPLGKKVVWASRASVGLIESPNYGDVVQNGPGGVQPPSVDRTKDYQLTFFRGFFSGGPNSNRGYPIRGVSPYDIVPFLTPEIEAGRVNAECSPDQVTGAPPPRCLTPTGGFTLWELSTEARISLTGPLSVAAFCDASDVSPQVNNLRLSHLHLSCGAGGRYDTPAGPIRLDIGYRIPGLQVLGGLTRSDREPDTLFGIPIAVAIGIGEAY